MPRFTVFRKDEVERSVTVYMDVIRIGRLDGVEILLDSPTVSRVHARVRTDGDRHVLEDAGSVNGVKIAGERIERHELAAGDSFAIQDYVIVYEPKPDVYDAGLAAERAGAGGGSKKSAMTFVDVGFLKKP